MTDLVTYWLTATAGLYGLSLAIFVAFGLGVEAWNRRHPERRIQDREARADRSDAIRSSVVQLLVTAALVATGLTLQRAGATPWQTQPLGWWSAPLVLVASILLHDAWFYWGHRLLHTKPLYRFHKPHHRNVVPTVWDNDAAHTVDTMVLHGFYVVVPLVLPIAPVLVVLHRVLDQVTAIIGHCGHEHFASPTARSPFPLLCTLFHDQHHSAFRYNYGNFLSVWDRLCGTLHPAYEEGVRRHEAVQADPAMGRTPAE